MEVSLPRYKNLPSRLFIVMGVAGSGKSSVGSALAAELEGKYLEGDDFHPALNVKKMSDGIPLTDEDRWPWLRQIGQELAKQRGVIVGGCSSLKRVYRERLVAAAGEPILFIYLDGSRSLIEKRMASRTSHFMPSSLLESQFETLEVPESNEFAISVDIDMPIENIVKQFLYGLKQISPTNCK